MDDEEAAQPKKSKKKLSKKKKKIIIGVVGLVVIIICALVLIYDNEPFSPNGNGKNNPPTANAGDNKLAFVGEEVTFDASGSSDPDGDKLTYHWSFSDAASYAGEVVKRYFNTTGNFTVTLTASDGQYEDSDEIYIEVIEQGPAAPPEITLTQKGAPGTIVPPKKYIVTIVTTTSHEDIDNFSFAIVQKDTEKILLQMDVGDLSISQSNVTFIDVPPYNLINEGDSFQILPDNDLPTDDGDEFRLYYYYQGSDVEVAKVTFETFGS